VEAEIAEAKVTAPGTEPGKRCNGGEGNGLMKIPTHPSQRWRSGARMGSGPRTMRIPMSRKNFKYRWKSITQRSLTEIEPRLPHEVDALTAWRQREGPHSRNNRSMFCALSKFLAASSPIGSINLVDARSAPLKSAPLTVTRASVAPPKAAPRSEALVRSAFLRDANSRSTRDKSASRKIARSRLLDFSTARMSPMD